MTFIALVGGQRLPIMHVGSTLYGPVFVSSTQLLLMLVTLCIPLMRIGIVQSCAIVLKFLGGSKVLRLL